VAQRLHLMSKLGLTWTEAVSLRLWEVAAMASIIEDTTKRAEMRERLQ
jgi:hypothetical protein